MSVSEELGKLADLHQRGVLSDDEFARAKARILDGGPATGAPISPPQALQAFRRSVTDRWLGGVCGGIARITNLPSWLWRLVFVFGLVFAGTGLLLYILLWIFVPEEPYYVPGPNGDAAAR